VLGRILTEYPGKVRLVFKDLPLPFHDGAIPAAEAARCAGEHGRFWEYHDLLFLAQPAFSKADLLGYAARLGLPADSFASCLESGRYREAVKADAAEARAAGVRGTPTFFVNGRRLVGAQPFEAFRTVIQEILDANAGKSS
jgi:protein-disulfide isomerase